MSMTPSEIEELLRQPTITPRQLLETGILPMGQNALYRAIQRGEIAVVGVGRKKAIVTAPLRKKLCLEGF